MVGFNDMPFAEDFWPPLTTVHMPLREIGSEAARLLLRGIEAGEQEAATLTLPVSLVVRGSTGPLRADSGGVGGVDDLTLGVFSPSVLLDVARSSGWLAAAGIILREVPVPSSPAQFASLRDAEFDAVFTSPDNVLAYRFLPANPLGELLDVEIVAGLDRGLGLCLGARPGITIRGPVGRPSRSRRADLGLRVRGLRAARRSRVVARRL